MLITAAKYAPAAGKPFMDEPISPTIKVDRPVEAEVILPDGDDDDEEKPEQPQATPTKQPEQPQEDVQLKKAIEVVKQASLKTAQKHASAAKFRMSTPGIEILESSQST